MTTSSEPIQTPAFHHFEITLVLAGHTYKYETEATAKIFLPFVRFQFCYEDRIPEGEYVYTKLEPAGQQNRLTVSLNIREKTLSRDRLVDASLDDKETEHFLAELLYFTLVEFTGITPQWGMSTGIRPVKTMEKRLAAGDTMEQAEEYFRTRFHAGEKKIALCRTIVEQQRPILAKNRRESVSVYIAIPFCPSRCRYCSFVSHSTAGAKSKALLAEYLEKLLVEIRLLRDKIENNHLHLHTVYIGGGTPTTLTAPQLDKLLTCVEECFPVRELEEFTVEAGRPDTITPEKLAVMRAHGVNRVSVNPQSFNDEVLALSQRPHTAAQAVEAFRMAKEAGFEVVNMDFIAGLPGDTLESFRHSLDTAIALDPGNITVHTLTIKRSADLFAQQQFALSRGQMQVGEMVEYAYDALTQAGYLPYYLYRQKNTLENLENVGYAKPGMICAYNIYMMDEVHSVLAAGGGGVTKLIRPGEKKVTRIFNHKYPFEYVTRFEELMERKEEIDRFYQQGE